MLTFRHTVAGESVTVNVPEDTTDLKLFWDWLNRARERGPIALDTETTGLNIYSAGYRLRTVQFGDAHEAWVLLYEQGGYHAQYAREAIPRCREVLIHNAAFDWLVLDEHAGIRLEDLAPHTTDTRILAALMLRSSSWSRREATAGAAWLAREERMRPSCRSSSASPSRRPTESRPTTAPWWSMSKWCGWSPSEPTRASTRAPARVCTAREAAGRRSVSTTVAQSVAGMSWELPAWLMRSARVCRTW
ncbi:hypothetical protein [Streptomyces showdoensis]|uniref:hypothetical protein n=1 Tax=Streptomyces showdoensis TaxID=68268 RepID=UPI003CD065E6